MDDKIDGNYKYTDEDIDKILKIKLENEQLVEPNIKLHAPISEEKMLEFFKDEIENSNCPNRVLLIPYLDGFHLDGHWIGVVVRFECGCAKKVEVYDSLHCEIPEKLNNCLKVAYETNNIVNGDAIKQDDVTSCGPCMIENLINAAKQDYANKPTLSEIRENHLMLMNEIHPDVKFSQLQNSSTPTADSTWENFLKYFDHFDIHEDWSVYNREGNECLSRNDIEGAIAKYDLAIKSNPNSAIPHYNKRLALSLQNTSDFKAVKNKNNKKTGFVLSVICHVPVQSSNDLSGKDNQNNNYNENILKTFKYTTSSPTLTMTPRGKERKGTEIKKEKNKLASKYVSVDAEIPTHNDEIKKKSDTVQPFLHKLYDQCSDQFFRNNFGLIKVSIGLNRMKSVSTEKNKFLWRELESTINTNIEYEIFGFFWQCNWYNKETGCEVNFKDVKNYYEQLLSVDTKSAKRFLDQEEGEFEKDPDNIPYQELREYAKNHLKTKKLVQQLKEKNVNVYLHIIDSDVVDFNGIFGAYSRIIEGCYQLPTVMTTGYEYSSDCKFGQAYRLLSIMDRMYRYRTAFHLPLGTYYPEPNMCILVPDSENTVPESFVDVKRGNRLESPIIISNIQGKRENPTFIFSEDKPLITPVPYRATIWKAPRAKRATKIEFSEECIDWPAVVQSDIKQFRKSSQSNFGHHSRMTNLLTNRYFEINDIFNKNIKNPGKKCDSIIAKLCKLEQCELSYFLGLKQLLNLTNSNTCTCSQLLKVIDEYKKIPEDFNKKYKQTDEEQIVLKFFREAKINLKPIPRETVLILATKSILKLIQEKVVHVSDLIQLSDEALHLIVENKELRAALRNEEIDNDTLFKLMDEQKINDFIEVFNETTTIENIVNLYKENPLHLEFLKRVNYEDWLAEHVYENSNDYNIVKMGLEEYHVNINNVKRLFDSEAAEMDFDLLVNCISPERDEYDEYDEHDENDEHGKH